MENISDFQKISGCKIITSLNFISINDQFNFINSFQNAIGRIGEIKIIDFEEDYFYLFEPYNNNKNNFISILIGEENNYLNEIEIICEQVINTLKKLNGLII